MEDYGYAQCAECKREFLAFSLRDGLCYWCIGSLTIEEDDRAEV